MIKRKIPLDKTKVKIIKKDSSVARTEELMERNYKNSKEKVKMRQYSALNTTSRLSCLQRLFVSLKLNMRIHYQGFCCSSLAKCTNE